MKGYPGVIFSFLLLTALLHSNSTHSFAAQSETYLPSSGIELQGISYDEKNPEESIAIISGGFFKKGDLYRSFTIIDVTPTTVIFEDLKGQQSKSIFAIGKLSATAANLDATEKIPNDLKPVAAITAKTAASTPPAAKASSGGGDLYGFHALNKARSSISEVNNQTQKKES